MKLCECGCGQPTRMWTVNDRWSGRVKGEYARFVFGHSGRAGTGADNVNWRGGRSSSDGYVRVRMPGHPRADRRHGYVSEHLLVAERALGRPVPARHVVHHINGDKADNRPSNLVLCESQTYHKLLHLRAAALAACGRADWRRCSYCGEWDDPANMDVKRTRHRACSNAHDRERRAQA